MDVILLCPQSSSIFSSFINNSMHSQCCSAQNTVGTPRTPDFSTQCKGAPGGALFCPPGPTSPYHHNTLIWLVTSPWLICRLSLSNMSSFFANHDPSWCSTGLLVHSGHRKSSPSLGGTGTPFASPPLWTLLYSRLVYSLNHRLR